MRSIAKLLDSVSIRKRIEKTNCVRASQLSLDSSSFAFGGAVPQPYQKTLQLSQVEKSNRMHNAFFSACMHCTVLHSMMIYIRSRHLSNFKVNQIKVNQQPNPFWFLVESNHHHLDQQGEESTVWAGNKCAAVCPTPPIHMIND